MKILELLLTVVRVVTAGVALVGGIVVLLSTYIHLRTRAADSLSARWYARWPRRVRRARPMDGYFVQYKRAVRDYNEEFFRLGKRLVPVVILAAGVFVATGVGLTLLG